MGLYYFNVWIHILMAAIWVGGLIYTAAVAVPFAVTHEAQERQRILRGLGRRFRRIGWVTIVLLGLTGIGNLVWRVTPIRLGQIFSGEVFDATKVEEPIATWLPWKLGLIVLMIALMLFHDITSIRAAKQHAGDPDSAPGNRAGSSAAALATLLAVAVLYFSVRLVRG